jgi:23S rRNA pseudouridine1911/1915/1917 synthase
MSNEIQNLKIKIVYEDDDILVVNKQAGIEVDQPRSDGENNIVNYLKKYFNQKNIFLVHRLDKFTSGLVVVAKNEKAQKNLEQQFRERKVKKVYHAIVLGIFDKKRGTIDAPIGLDRKIKQKRCVFRGGEKATTNYETLKRINDEFTLVKLEPVTGRTHQLRVHMEYIGHPIVGDKLYFGRVENLKTKGFALIAKRIEFYHPVTNCLEKFEIKYGEEFERILEELK